MKKRVSEIRVGDIVAPPARELSLWMRRDAKEKGYTGPLAIKVTNVQDGNPDKRGPWVIISGYMPDAWYNGREPYLWTFKSRPNVMWPLYAENTVRGGRSMNTYDYEIYSCLGSVKAENMPKAIIKALQDYLKTTDPPYISDTSERLEIRIKKRRERA